MTASSRSRSAARSPSRGWSSCRGWRRPGVTRTCSGRHNDSGGRPSCTPSPRTARRSARIRSTGADGRRLGGHGGGPAPDGTDTVLYVGDIGDNEADRPTVTVYRVPEPGEAPAAPGVPLDEVEAIELTVPRRTVRRRGAARRPPHGRPRDRDQEPSGTSRVLECRRRVAGAGAPVAMVDAGGAPGAPAARPGGRASRARWSPAATSRRTGRSCVLRTYRSVLVFARADDQTVAEALLGEPCFGSAGGGAAGRGDRLHRRRRRLRHDQRRARTPPIHRVGLVRAARHDDHHRAADDDGRRRAAPTDDDGCDHRGDRSIGGRRPARGARRRRAALVAAPRARQAPGSSVRPSWRAASGTNASGANGPSSTDDSWSSGSTTLPRQRVEPHHGLGHVVHAERAHREVDVVEHRGGDRARW